MKNNLKNWRRVVAMVGIMFGLMVPATNPFADDSNDDGNKEELRKSSDADVKGQPKIHGKTYGEWSAKWWQ